MDKIQNDAEYMMSIISMTLLLAEHPNAIAIRDHILATSQYLSDVAYTEGVKAGKEMSQ
ncbi:MULTISPECIES: hypothetical protein [unclassified Streptomyces]|uniref:hypothetical protein n=1 Tax=Streptomyces sp. NPDC056835 TaxID=3345956 RepID=UPI0036CAD7E6